MQFFENETVQLQKAVRTPGEVDVINLFEFQLALAGGGNATVVFT
jgi:hypothetical protein